MQHSKILLLLVVLLTCLASCSSPKYASSLDQRSPSPTKKPQKASLKIAPQTLESVQVKDNQALVFEVLYHTRLDILAYNRTEALANIQKAQQLLQGDKILGNITEPIIKITYTQNGINTPCYLPLEEKDQKFYLLEDLMQKLQAKNVKPGSEYELVTFNRTIKYNVATALLNDATVLIEQANIESPAQGFIEADRKIQKIYTTLGPSAYKAENQLLLEDNIKLAKVFFDHERYDLSRQALTQTEDYIKKQEMEITTTQADKLGYLTDYKNTIAEMKVQLDQKSPTGWGKFSNNISGFLSN
jgi:hypothetical protein